MKIIFVNPVIRPQDPPFHIPFGIATLSRIADQLGHEVGILDLNAHRLGVDAFREEFKDADYKDTDVVGIGGLSSQYKFIKPLLPVIKQVRPDALLVAGNGLLTTLPEDVMKLLPQVDVGCFAAGTPIVGNPSIRPIEEITVGNQVLAHDGEYHQVSHVYARHYTGQIIELKPEYDVPALVTPEHPILVVRTRPCKFIKRNGKPRRPCSPTCPFAHPDRNNILDCKKSDHAFFEYHPEWIRADEVRVGDFLVYPIFKVVEDLDQISLPPIPPTYSVVQKQWNIYPRVLELHSQGRGENTISRELSIPKSWVNSWIYKSRKPAKMSEIPPDKVSVDEDLLLLIGYYLAEGCVSRNSIYFSFGKEEDAYVTEVIDLFHKIFNLKPTMNRVLSGSRQLIFCSKKVSVFFEQFNKHADSKTVPLWVMKLPPNKQRNLLKGFWRGDGYMHPQGFSMKTISKNLAYFLKQLLLRQGIVPRLSYKKPGMEYFKPRRRFYPTKAQYNISVWGADLERFSDIVGIHHPWLSKRTRSFQHSYITDGYAYIQVVGVLPKFHNGVVYNIEVEGIHSYALSNNICAHNCIGEGERTFAELLDVVDSKNFSRVKGLIYREGGELVRTPYRPLIENLDKEVPWPHWDMLPLEIYFQFSANLMGPASPPELQRSRRRMSIVTERGCPRQCTFCQHLGMSALDLSKIYGQPIKGPAVRFHSAKYVVDMVKHLRFKYQVDFVSILDENFLANKKRAYEIADLWEREDLAGLVHFGVLGDVASADYELLQRLRDVGLTYVSYGGEVASDRLLKEIKKFTTVGQMQNAIDVTFKAGVTPIVTFMMGYPTEKVEDILATVEFWKKNMMAVRPFLITPYPGTELFYEHRDRILAQHGNDMDRFLSSLGDATDLSANISPWSDVELLGLQQLMTAQDTERIKGWARERGLLKEGQENPPVPWDDRKEGD